MTAMKAMKDDGADGPASRRLEARLAMDVDDLLRAELEDDLLLAGLELHDTSHFDAQEDSAFDCPD